MAAAIFFCVQNQRNAQQIPPFGGGMEKIASTANEYPFAENACWDNPKPLYRKAVRKWKTEREIYR